MLGKAQTTKVLGNPHRTCLPSAIQVPQFAGFRYDLSVFVVGGLSRKNTDLRLMRVLSVPFPEWIS